MHKKISKALKLSLLIGALYAKASGAQNPDTNTTPKENWSNQSQWLYSALSSNFAKQNEAYPDAINAIEGVAEASKQYDAFAYSYDLALSALRLDQALKIAQAWSNNYPEDSDARLALINIHILKGQNDQAFEESKTLLTHDAGPQNIAQISRLLNQLHPADARINLYLRLSAHFPQNPYLYYYLGIAAQDQGQIDLAIDAFAQALKIDKYWRQLELMQAKALSGIGDLQGARQMIENIRKRYPDDLSLLATEIDILVEHYQWQDALELAKQWDKTTPGNPNIQELIAWLYANNKEYTMAKKSYQYLYEHHHIDEEQMIFQLGQAAISAKEYDKARQWLEKIPQTSRLYMLSSQQLALLEFEEDHIEKAQEAFAKLRENFPEYALEIYLVEIKQLLQKKQYTAIDARFNEALKTYPEHIELLYSQAEYLSARHKIDDAEKIYQKILELDPENIDALNAYGYLLLTQSTRQSEARAMIEEAIQKYPDSPAIQDSYGWMLYRQGKPKEALKWLQRAYSVYRKNEIIAHYIEILAANDQKTLAQAIYYNERKAQNNNPHLQAVGIRLGWEEPLH